MISMQGEDPGRRRTEEEDGGDVRPRQPPGLLSPCKKVTLILSVSAAAVEVKSFSLCRSASVVYAKSEGGLRQKESRSNSWMWMRDREGRGEEVCVCGWRGGAVIPSTDFLFFLTA